MRVIGARRDNLRANVGVGAGIGGNFMRNAEVTSSFNPIN